MTKRLQTSMLERENEISSLRRELRQSISERDEEIRILRAELQQSHDRTRMIKEAASDRDEEIKSLREQMKSRDDDITLLRANVAALQESLESLKHRLDASPGPAAEAITTNEDRANKRPRLHSNHDASTNDGVPLAIRQKIQSLKDKVNVMIDSVIMEGDDRATTL